MKQSELWNEIYALRAQIKELEAEVKSIEERVEAKTVLRISDWLLEVHDAGPPHESPEVLAWALLDGEWK